MKTSTAAGSTPRGRKSRADIYAMLAESVDSLKSQLGGLPSPIEAEDIWGDIWYQEAHNSTAIEGNTLVLKEVELLLHDGKTVGEKPLADYLEVHGYARAAQWVYSQGFDRSGWSTLLLSLAEVRHVHQLAMDQVWQVRPH